MPTEIVSRAEAIAKGLSYFWSETPCKRAGHIGWRRVKSYDCYECSKQRNREWHASHPELAREKYDRFVENNPTYYPNYNKGRPEECKAARKRWRKKYPEKHAAQTIRYRRKYPKKVQAQRKRRRAESPAVAIRLNMASRLAMAIRRAIGKKSASTMELVGCDIEQLMAHLESLFLPGMTWLNYGLGNDRWHCDHIRPCVSFDLADPAQQRECFHFRNLQPLWQPDNLRKGARR